LTPLAAHLDVSISPGGQVCTATVPGLVPASASQSVGKVLALALAAALLSGGV
jgi:hypothetical protein